jgi:hypothetical protein
MTQDPDSTTPDNEERSYPPFLGNNMERFAREGRLSAALTRPSHAAWYAIACQGRQGSTYLERILDAHPQVYCGGEIFSDFAFKEHGGPAVAWHLHFKVFAHMKPVVGFKLSVADIMRHAELAALVNEYKFRVIRLTRDNLLDQFISTQLAVANGAFVAEVPGKGITKIRTSQAELKAAFEWFAFADLAMGALFSELPTFSITYEDLIKPESQPDIFEFLGVEPMTIEPRSRKQRTGGQRDGLENYDEMKEAFAGTRWARYFVE